MSGFASKIGRLILCVLPCASLSEDLPSVRKEMLCIIMDLCLKITHLWVGRYGCWSSGTFARLAKVAALSRNGSSSAGRPGSCNEDDAYRRVHVLMRFLAHSSCTNC